MAAPVSAPKTPFSAITVAAPLVLTSTAFVALLAGNMAVFVVASLVMAVEVGAWVPRFYAWMGRRPYVAAVIVAGLLAWIVNPVRVATGVIVGAWWFVGWPMLVVNRHRWHERKARRSEAKARKIAATARAAAGAASTPTGVLGAAAAGVALSRPQAAAALAPVAAPAPAQAVAQPMSPPIGFQRGREGCLTLTDGGEVQFDPWDDEGLPL